MSNIINYVRRRNFPGKVKRALADGENPQRDSAEKSEWNLTTDDSMSHELPRRKGGGGVVSVRQWTISSYSM